MSSATKEILSVQELSVHLPGSGGTVRAVDRVSLTVERGETLALVGESGSGKSMLCRAIMGLLPRRAVLPGERRVLFRGEDLAHLRPKELSRIRGREIGMVLQNPMSSLNPVLTIGRQIVEPMLYHMGISKGEAKGRALELLQAVGIARADEIFSSHPHQLSGGMRQRVAIAIALSCDLKLLIADEPTTALDVTVQAEILNLLGRLQKEREMAMILVTHNLSVVAGRAHRTAVMYAGRIVECASTTALFDRPRMWYTRGLLGSIPRIDSPPGSPLTAIEGRPPDPAAPAAGCPFAPRCPRAAERCRMDEPPLRHCAEDEGTGGGEGESHLYACWFPSCEGGHATEDPPLAASATQASPPLRRGDRGDFSDDATCDEGAYAV
jgi:peptide/nickel transport system ATP-binding protein